MHGSLTQRLGSTSLLPSRHQIKSLEYQLVFRDRSRRGSRAPHAELSWPAGAIFSASDAGLVQHLFSGATGLVDISCPTLPARSRPPSSARHTHLRGASHSGRLRPSPCDGARVAFAEAQSNDRTEASGQGLRPGSPTIADGKESRRYAFGRSPTISATASTATSLAAWITHCPNGLDRERRTTPQGWRCTTASGTCDAVRLAAASGIPVSMALLAPAFGATTETTTPQGGPGSCAHAVNRRE